MYFQVIESEKFQDAVYPLAANIFDRYLAVKQIKTGGIQLLGSVCLILASKLRQNRTLSFKEMSSYTDFTYTCQEIEVSRNI